MMTRRMLPWALATVLLIGGSDRWRTQPRFSPFAPGEARVVYFDTSDQPAAARPSAQPDGERSKAVAATAPVRELDAGASAVVGEVAALQALAAVGSVPLSPDQWRTLAEVTLHHQAIRQAYEAGIAELTARSATTARLVIPAYPDAGDALRGRLRAEILARLGPAVGGEVLRQLGPALEGHFGGFGVSTQTLEFSAGADGGGADYAVTRTVRYWNGSATGPDSERLRTRRETFFPALEDPEGHAWGPFLAVVYRAGR